MCCWPLLVGIGAFLQGPTILIVAVLASLLLPAVADALSCSVGGLVPGLAAAAVEGGRTHHWAVLRRRPRGGRGAVAAGRLP